jgi:hypothetical protein
MVEKQGDEKERNKRRWVLECHIFHVCRFSLFPLSFFFVIIFATIASSMVFVNVHKPPWAFHSAWDQHLKFVPPPWCQSKIEDTLVHGGGIPRYEPSMQFIMSNLPGDVIVTHSNGKHELQSDCRLLRPCPTVINPAGGLLARFTNSVARRTSNFSRCARSSTLIHSLITLLSPRPLLVSWAMSSRTLLAHPSFYFSPMSPWSNANGDSIWPSLVVTFFEEDMLKCWLLFRGWK